MCSIPAHGIAEFGQDIDDLAAAAARSSTGAGDQANADTDAVVARLAALWARLAEMEPDIARRLPGYQL
jgi:hypothetical protein